MKRIFVAGTLLMLSISSVFAGCGNSNQKNTEDSAQEGTGQGTDQIDGADSQGQEHSGDQAESVDQEGSAAPNETLAEESYSPEELAVQTTITTAEVQALMAEKNELVIIDLRDPTAYASGHIQQAVRIDPDDLEGLLKEGLRNKEVHIVVYSESRITSQEVADLLSAKGFVNVKNLGNMGDWTGELVVD